MGTLEKYAICILRILSKRRIKMEIFIRFVTMALCHSITLFIMSRRKYNIKVSIFAWSGIFILTTILSIPTLFGVSTVQYRSLMFVSVMILYSVVYIVTSAEGFLRNLFIFATYATLFVFLVFFINYVADTFMDGSEYAKGSIRLTVYAIYIGLLLKFIKPMFQQATRNIVKGWGTLTALAVVFCITLTTIGIIAELYLRSEWWYIIIVIGLFFIMIASYFVVYKMIIYLNEESKKQRLEMQQKQLHSELIAEKEFVESAKHYRHDLRHHNKLIKEYLDRSDIEGAKAYLSAYEGMITDDALPEYCENVIVNSTLRIVARRCKELGIKFEINTEIPEELPLLQPETGIVFSNLFENACEVCDNASLRIHAQIKNNTLYVETQNTVIGTVIFERNLPQTTKQGGGIGFSSMRSVLDKHGGMLNSKQDGTIFITQIILPL